MEDILKEWTRLDRAVIDSSSIIYAEKAGFLKPLCGALDLVTVQGVEDETGLEHAGLRVLQPDAGRTDHGVPVDIQLAQLAVRLRIPLISEDRKLLVKFGESGLPFYNALMMLHFLLYRGVVSMPEHQDCLYRLLAAARYSQKVLSYGNTLHMEVLKRL